MSVVLYAIALSMCVWLRTVYSAICGNKPNVSIQNNSGEMDGSTKSQIYKGSCRKRNITGNLICLGNSLKP